MKFAFFTVPVMNLTQEQSGLNAFLARQRVVNVDRQLVTEAGHAVWAPCVTYFDGDGQASNTAASSRHAPV